MVTLRESIDFAKKTGITLICINDCCGVKKVRAKYPDGSILDFWEPMWEKSCQFSIRDRKNMIMACAKGVWLEKWKILTSDTYFLLKKDINNYK